MADLPRIVLEPMEGRDLYGVTVEAPGGEVRPIAADEIRSLLGEVLELVPTESGQSGHRLIVGRIDLESIYWSDSRLKSDLRSPVTHSRVSVLERVRSVRGVSYRWRSGDESRGVIPSRVVGSSASSPRKSKPSFPRPFKATRTA